MLLKNLGYQFSIWVSDRKCLLALKKKFGPAWLSSTDLHSIDTMHCWKGWSDVYFHFWNFSHVFGVKKVKLQGISDFEKKKWQVTEELELLGDENVDDFGQLDIVDIPRPVLAKFVGQSVLSDVFCCWFFVFYTCAEVIFI
jgi:hypothetical protein